MIVFATRAWVRSPTQFSLLFCRARSFREGRHARWLSETSSNTFADRVHRNPKCFQTNISSTASPRTHHNSHCASSRVCFVTSTSSWFCLNWHSVFCLQKLRMLWRCQSQCCAACLTQLSSSCRVLNLTNQLDNTSGLLKVIANLYTRADYGFATSAWKSQFGLNS